MIRAAALSTAALVALTAIPATGTAQVRAGILECRGAPTTSFLIGSEHQLACIFHSDRGRPYRYYGIVHRAGVDIGFTDRSALAWAVFAPTRWIGPTDLSGNYGGLSAGLAVGVGGNAYALVGGSNNSFALQPLSFEGQNGLNVAVGLADLELRPAGVHAHRYVRRAHHHS
jgi:Protein of unknown function (DUF992)